MPRLNYKLDDLDWSGFEQLVQALLKARLGLGVEAWGGHGDWGRDAYFEGKLNYPTDVLTEGPFVFQCKLVEGANAAGARPEKPLLSAVRKECARIKAKLGASDGWTKPPSCYALFTNAPLSPPTRSEVQRRVKEVLQDTKIFSHDGQDVCQWLRLSPEVAESFPQFQSHWSKVRCVGVAILFLVVVLGFILGAFWLNERRGQQRIIAGQTNLNARMASLEKALSSQLQKPSQLGEGAPRIDFPRALRDWAKQYSIPLEQAQRELEAWIAEVRQHSTDLSERARAEFLAQHFAEAARLSDEAAGAKLDRSRALGKTARELIGEAVTDYTRAGEALRAAGQFAEALARFEKALEYSPRAANPARWASVQDNLGICHYELGVCVEGAASSEHLRSAVAAHQEALKIRTRQHLPWDWAISQNNFGVALYDQAARSASIESARQLGDAIAAFREALSVRTRERSPQDWAGTLNNLGSAVLAKAIQTEGPGSGQLLGEALAAYRDALKVYTREQLPRDWAATQNNLGVALRAQAEQCDGTMAVRLLEEAVMAYRQALNVRRREQLPQDWAMTQNNLAIALSDQAKRTEGPEAVR